VIAFVRGRLVSPPAASCRPRRNTPDAYQVDPATRLAIDAVESVFLRDFKWSFRRLPASNSGIDARAEILDEGRPTGRLLALQIRPEQSRGDKGGDYIYRGESGHLEYWMKHTLPVYVIVVDPETDLILWQRVEKRLCNNEETGWSVAIPAANVLDATTRLSFDQAIASDPESRMRSIFALDRALMEEMQDQTTFFVWDEWADALTNSRNLRIYLGGPLEGEPDMEIDYYLRAGSLHEIMTTLFPWATYSYARPVAEYSDEVAVHTLEVELRPEAHAYIEAENFLEAGFPEEREPLEPEPEDFITEEEEQQFWRSRRGLHRPYDRES